MIGSILIVPKSSFMKGFVSCHTSRYMITIITFLVVVFASSCGCHNDDDVESRTAALFLFIR